jgi:hypothetical protein
VRNLRPPESTRSNPVIARYLPRFLLVLGAALLAMPTPTSAIENIALVIGRVDGGDWSGDDVELELGFPADDQVSLKVHGRGLTLPAPFDSLRSASVECPRAEVTEAGIECAAAELRVGAGSGDVTPLSLSLGLDQMEGDWRLHMSAAELAPGRLWAFASGQGLLPPLEVRSGALSISLQLSAGAKAPAARIGAVLAGLSFSDAPGLHAGEGLKARLDWRLSDIGGDWRSTGELQLDAGQLYLDPVFIDAGATPVSISARGDYQPASGVLRLSDVRFQHDSVAAVDGALRIGRSNGLEFLDLHLSRTSLDALYRNYLQPFAIGTLFDTLQVEGDVDAHLLWQPSPERRRVQLNFYAAGIDDNAARFSMSGITGHLDWIPSGQPKTTSLSWEGGQFYRIDFGPGRLEGRFAGRRFDLGAPLSVPLLEGTVQIDALEAAAIGTPALRWKFRGAVRPMSLEALTRSLAWPLFGGTLAGDVPVVSYADGTISVDGSLDIAVFDGRVRVRQLSIVNPFGIIPVLRADVDVEDLSLDALTGTFSFGKIQGKLQGRVHGLILKDWKPTAFDARFFTPEDDKTRHRISQRAVENLASLGGAGAVLSSTFLRIFEEFSYRRLGISCRLSRGVCEMDGVAPAQSGYYIVEGGGLPPRIDVIGFNRRVDWQVLLGRVRQINATEGPVIR